MNMKINESVLDSPLPFLDPMVWTIDEDGKIFLTDEAEKKIKDAVNYIKNKFSLSNLKVYIIGSITSNSYSEDSDIDINLFDPAFLHLPEKEYLSLASKIKKDFKDNYADKNLSKTIIGTHPFEIYVQNNIYKCYASVGCYDFFKKTWEVGPDLKNLGYDPVSTYFKRSMKYAKELADLLRALILDIYENALISLKSNDDSFKKNLRLDLVRKLKDAKSLFDNIRKTRAKYDVNLDSKHAAELKRKNERWHTVDAAYKFMDKFGYIHILKELVDLNYLISKGKSLDDIELLIVDIVKSTFSDIKSLNDSEQEITDESVLDVPQRSLDPSVWIVDSDSNKITLTVDARTKIQNAIEYILSKFRFPNLKVYIIGSITSNSYSEDSDIDINLFDPSFNDMTEELRSALATEVKQDFQKNYTDVYPAESMIGTHPFEIYILNNVFKCFASVGCYDFFEDKWEVGPDFKEADFDPISHYYSKSMKFAKNFVELLRTLILETYENALIVQKSNDEDFKEQQKKELVNKLKDSKELYKNIKKTRAKYDDDLSSKEDAEKRRKNENWHTVDAAYKLMDKFGYIHILKSLAETYNRIEDGETIENIEGLVIDLIQLSFSLKTIHESKEQIDEGLASNLAIAALLAIPGILPKDALALELNKVPRNLMYMTSNAVQKAINNATEDNTMIGNFSVKNTINILQWVYYTEAANQSLEGRKAIYSIVWNRAGGDPTKLIPVVLKSGINKKGIRVWQFSEWNPGNNWGLVAPNTNADWKYKLPKDITNPKVLNIWKEAEIFAKLMLAGKWKSNIGKCNMIASDNDNEEAKKSWGNNCSFQIGAHRFGYDPYQDGFRSKKANLAKTVKANQNYVVKKGDSLWKIAKKYGTTANALASKNNIDVNGILKLGQKLKV